MADIFQSRRGMVAVLAEQDGVVGKIRVDGFEPMAAIIESIHFRQASNQQFQTSLEEAVYIYVFGDQMGALLVNGVLFAGRCNGNGGGGDNGLKELMDFYDDFRASNRKEVITVDLTERPVSGFLTELTITPRDPEFQLSNFSLKINSLPKKKSA